MFRLLLALIFMFLLAGPGSLWASSIDVDGRLDEPQWQQAIVLSDFHTVQPLTLQRPEYSTEAWLHVDDSGLYIAFRNQQPATLERRKPNSRRDQQADADRINVMIDFDGRGQTAYEFTVSLAGSIQDAVISDQNRFSYDWDGLWSWAVHEETDYWSAELHLPWDIVPMTPSQNGEREIGLYLSRVVQSSGLRYSMPGYNFDRPGFVADMHRVRVPDHAHGRLDLVPYVSLLHDRLDQRSDMRAGVDVFWQPNPATFVAATLNPDFGQVESDDLVVNFDAVETLFSEKRPFFTAQQSLFRVQAPDGTLLVNTRRIGGRPDDGPDGISELTGAALLTGRQGNFELGTLIASEADPEDARGRDFQLLRLRHGDSRGSRALTLSRVDRPTLDREARVAAVDMRQSLGDGMSLSAMLAISDPSGERVSAVPGGSGEARSGYGGFASLNYAPGGRWQHQATLSSLDRHLDLNDFGFQRRAGLHQLETRSIWYRRSYPDGSAWQDSQWQLDSRYAHNDSGVALPTYAQIGYQARRRSTSNIYAYLSFTEAGVDDLLLRGNGVLRLPSRIAMRAGYETPRAGRLRTRVELRAFEEGLGGWARQISVSPTWYLRDSLTFSGSATWTDSPDWLIWRGSDRSASFEREQWNLSANADWYLAPRHEFRARLQWVGLNALGKTGYRPDAAQQPEADGEPVENFSLSTLGLQLRYRFELRPLSDLYVVYARGGFNEDDDAERGPWDLWRAGSRQRSADQLLVKLSYRY